jgi:hypothetical protein
LGIGIPAVRGGFLGRVPGVRRPEVHHKLDGVAVDSEKAVLLETTTAARLRGAWLVWHNFADAPDLTKGIGWVYHNGQTWMEVVCLDRLFR